MSEPTVGHEHVIPIRARRDESGEGVIVPDTFHEHLQAEILKAFNLKPWHVGLAPVPWRVRVWNKVSFARWQAQRRFDREEAEERAA